MYEIALRIYVLMPIPSVSGQINPEPQLLQEMETRRKNRKTTLRQPFLQQMKMLTSLINFNFKLKRKMTA